MHEELGGDNEHVDCDGQEHWYHYSESPNEMYGLDTRVTSTTGSQQMDTVRARTI